MKTMNISLPDPMKRFVEKQVKEGAYGTSSEYVRQLIRNEQERKKLPQLEALLLEAIEEGNPIDGTPEYWKKKRDLVRKLAERKSAKNTRSK